MAPANFLEVPPPVDWSRLVPPLLTMCFFFCNNTQSTFCRTFRSLIEICQTITVETPVWDRTITGTQAFVPKNLHIIFVSVTFIKETGTEF